MEHSELGKLALLTLLVATVTCASEQRMRIPDSAPERVAAMRASDRESKAESNEERFGVDEAKQRREARRPAVDARPKVEVDPPQGLPR